MEVRQRRAMTLVELLVILAILSVLVGLLIPSLVKGVGRAMTVSCANNQRQQGSGFQLFAEDHGSMFPPLTTPMYGPDLLPNNWIWSWQDWIMLEMNEDFASDAGKSGFIGFDEFMATGKDLMSMNYKNGSGHAVNSQAPSGLREYHEGSFLDCPESLPDPGTGGNRQDYLAPLYGILGYKPLSPTRRYGRDWQQVSKPSSRILAMDAGVTRSGIPGSDPARRPAIAGSTVINPWPTGLLFGSNVSIRHQGGANALYLDGHISYLADLFAFNPDFSGCYWHQDWKPNDDAPWLMYFCNTVGGLKVLK
ncbi:MAG: prepilin-type N-terminal cleavage/methylation domain-containing protein [Planctomycetes bacterium]|nr:prepilin-type N-terminal cleavage/methylation domain-containing protein [Planctomycetota bacterium]